MSIKDVNIVLDFVLIGASIWMLYSVRGIGGIVGRSLNLIIAGAIVLGFAHFITDELLNFKVLQPDPNNLVHRLIVLVGFVLVTLGFQRVRELAK